MKRYIWPGLCIVLLGIDVWMGVTVNNLRKSPFSGKLYVEKENEIISLPYKESLLTLLVYFSYRSCQECMRESEWWNKLFMDLPSNELSVVGIIPGNEEIEGIKNRYNILFPIFYDKDLMIARSLLISETPLRIIIDKRGRILYRAPTSSVQSTHQNFYFDLIEILRKIKEEEALRQKGKPIDIF
jgi:peroxiredoxin